MSDHPLPTPPAAKPPDDGRPALRFMWWCVFAIAVSSAVWNVELLPRMQALTELERLAAYGKGGLTVLCAYVVGRAIEGVCRWGGVGPTTGHPSGTSANPSL